MKRSLRGRRRLFIGWEAFSASSSHRVCSQLVPDSLRGRLRHCSFIAVASDLLPGGSDPSLQLVSRSSQTCRSTSVAARARLVIISLRCRPREREIGGVREDEVRDNLLCRGREAKRDKMGGIMGLMMIHRRYECLSMMQFLGYLSVYE